MRFRRFFTAFWPLLLALAVLTLALAFGGRTRETIKQIELSWGTARPCSAALRVASNS